MARHIALFRLLTLLLLCVAAPPPAACVEVGAPAPALVVKQADGHTFDLAALQSHVVILHYWATWCEPCRVEMPVLDAFYQRYHPRGMDMLAISLDNIHARGALDDRMRLYHFPVAMLRDADSDGLGTPDAIPLTYIIDKKGIVRDIFMPTSSILSEKQLSDAVLPLLQEKSVPVRSMPGLTFP